MRLLISTVCAAGILLGTAASVSAEIVYLTTGRTMSVKGHRFDGEKVTLQLRGGGELTCGASLIVRITPDEVPYPEKPVVDHAAPLPAYPVPAEYGELIEQASAAHGVDPRLVHAVIRVESSYQPRARSPKGAMGLMQLMPATARSLAVSDPYDPASNIDAGVRHLKRLLERFELSLALAAYNAGEAAVERFRGIPPYAETRRYVAAVLRFAGLASDAPARRR